MVEPMSSKPPTRDEILANINSQLIETNVAIKLLNQSIKDVSKMLFKLNDKIKDLADAIKKK
jgi:hypothetical protein